MKGCLKLKSAVPSPSLRSYASPSSSPSSHPRKTVAFGEEEVYFADVWDRTATAPAGRLTYEDLQELKEIQRSLPVAQQLPDPVSGKIPSQYLDTVPVGLLPLLPAISPPPTLPPPPSTSWVPALPKRPPPQPTKPTFAFLPLLDAPPSPSPPPHHDDHDPPTPSLTNESSPLSRASSSSPEPAFLSLDPDPPPLALPAHPRRKNVMILNGIEIELELDDDDSHTPPLIPSTRPLPFHAPVRGSTGAG